MRWLLRATEVCMEDRSLNGKEFTRIITNKRKVATTMGDVDETAKLWKVNRTIHELVRDRVCLFLSLISTLNPLSSRASQSQTRKFIWISNAFAISTPTTPELSSKSLSLAFTPF